MNIRIITAHQCAQASFLKAHPGEELTPGQHDEDWPGWIWCTNREGKGAWIPEKYLNTRGNICTLTRDYDATELSVDTGDVLRVEAEESGWLWCVNAAGKHGWIPATNAERHAE